MSKIYLILFSVFIIYSQEYRPGNHSLIFMPTAETIPEGRLYLESFELYFLDGKYGLTDHIQLSAFTGVNMLSLGMKFRYLTWKEMQFSGFLGYDPIYQASYVQNTISYGKKNRLHASFLIINPDENGSMKYLIRHKTHNLMVGSDIRLSDSWALLVEYLFRNEFRNNYIDEEYIGSIALRYTVENALIEIGALNSNIADDVRWWPTIKFGYLF